MVKVTKSFYEIFLKDNQTPPRLCVVAVRGSVGGYRRHSDPNNLPTHYRQRKKAPNIVTRKSSIMSNINALQNHFLNVWLSSLDDRSQEEESPDPEKRELNASVRLLVLASRPEPVTAQITPQGRPDLQLQGILNSRACSQSKGHQKQFGEGNHNQGRRKKNSICFFLSGFVSWPDHILIYTYSTLIDWSIKLIASPMIPLLLPPAVPSSFSRWSYCARCRRHTAIDPSSLTLHWHACPSFPILGNH